MKRIGLVVVAALCLAFGLRALLLVDATALWGMSSNTVGKSFQPSFSRLMAMLREDTHPRRITPCSDFGDILLVRTPSASDLLAGLRGGWSGDGVSGHGLGREASPGGGHRSAACVLQSISHPFCD